MMLHLVRAYASQRNATSGLIKFYCYHQYVNILTVNMITDCFILHYTLHSATLVEEQLRQRMDALGIRHKQARVIDALARMEPTSQVALAREFDVSAASMSTMTVRLIEAGYVSRTSHPDEARSNVLRLTESGRGLLGEIHSVWNEMDAMIVDRLGPEDAETYARLTRKLRDKLGGHVPGTPRKGTSSSQKKSA